MSKFNDALTAWKKAHDGSNGMLAECVSLALEQLAANFQMSNLQKLNDAIVERKNTVRHDAFCDWLANFFPIKMEQGKLKKSSARYLEMDWEANKDQIIEDAKKVHFWDYKPGRVVSKFESKEAAAKQAAKSVVKLIANRCDFDVTDEDKEFILAQIRDEVMAEAA